MAITRRKMLGSAAAASLLPFVGSPARGRTADLDVAIVGGGVAGAYTAWRLATAAPHLRVRLFEMSDRIGGRLRSVAFPKAPHLVGEVGGMRFLDAHRHVAPLVAHLNLPKRGYPLMGPNNRLDLRGRSLTYEQAKAAKSPPFTYNVPPEEMRPNSPVYLDRISRIIPDAKTMTAEKWKRQRAGYRYKGRALKDWTGWMLLSDVFSREELAFGDDAGGYDQDESIHGLNAMDFNFIGPDFSKPFYTVVGGYQRLPLALAMEAKKLGARLAMQARLHSVIAPSHPGEAFQLAFEEMGGVRSNVTAKQVVLALPRRSIELIDEFPLRRHPAFADLISAVTPVATCKALLLYPRPWWHDEGIAGGRSVTDMPARQFYVLGSEKERTSAEPTNGFGVLMMYCNARPVQYWKASVPPAKADAAGFQWLSPQSQLVQEVHHEAALTYATAPPQPVAACFQDWTADPFGGGWHNWGLGRDNLALADRVLKPLPEHSLYICGEAYGTYESGWVETALERAETMLQKHFGLKPAEWL